MKSVLQQPCQTHITCNKKAEAYYDSVILTIFMKLGILPHANEVDEWF